LHLDQGRLKLEQLNELVAALYAVSPGGKARFQRYVWLRKKGIAKKLLGDFARLRENLCFLLMNSSV